MNTTSFSRLFCAAVMLLCAATLTAQNDSTFFIGTWGFAPEYDLPPRVQYSVRGVDTGTAPYPDSVRFHRLTRMQFERARELGLNLAGVTVETWRGTPSNVITQSIPPNTDSWQRVTGRGWNGDFVRRDGNPLGASAVEEICAAAADSAAPLMVSIYDFALDDYLREEHHMFHPESDDFRVRRAEHVWNEEFNHFPMRGTYLSTPLTGRDAGKNAVRISPGTGVIEGLHDEQKRALSVFREGWNERDRRAKRSSGLYLLSAIVRTDNTRTAVHPPDSSRIVMQVEIVSRDPANPAYQRTLSFPLRGEQFYENGRLRSGPFAVVLGAIEIRETAAAGDIGPVVYVRQRDTDNAAWSDTTAHGRGKISDRDTGFEDIDLRIRSGTARSAFLLDAVCLSNPAAFALLYPAHPDGIPAFTWRRSETVTRLRSILTDNGARTDIFPGLRFIGGPEQGRHSGVWTTTLMGQKLIDSLVGDRAGQVHIYAATAYSERPSFTGGISGLFASGHYYYPVDGRYPIPTHSGTHPGHYHSLLNRPDIRGFTEMAKRWRMHAEVRRDLPDRKPWIPFIQNHSNRFLTQSPAWFDGDPTREPTAAEIRQQCNLSIGHGAEGVLFYYFTSGPWLTADPHWPADYTSWWADTIGGPRALDRDMGTLGFLHGDLTRRTCDWNGENKWDSTAAYIRGFLRPMGNYIRAHLVWQRSKIWSLTGRPDAGENIHVARVTSFRLGNTLRVDAPDSTFVQISEFTGRESGTAYLFVMNGRTHQREGHRHITIELSPPPGDARGWRLTKVLGERGGERRDGATWIVAASDDPADGSPADRSPADGSSSTGSPDAQSPDAPARRNAFTDYFAPASAALYRMDIVVE